MQYLAHRFQNLVVRQLEELATHVDSRIRQNQMSLSKAEQRRFKKLRHAGILTDSCKYSVALQSYNLADSYASSRHFCQLPYRRASDHPNSHKSLNTDHREPPSRCFCHRPRHRINCHRAPTQTERAKAAQDHKEAEEEPLLRVAIRRIGRGESRGFVDAPGHRFGWLG